MEDISREEELFGSYLISLNKGGKLKTEIEKIDNLGQLQPLPERRFKLFHVPDPNLILPELAGGNNFMLPHISAKLKLANKKNFSDGLVAKKNINQGDVLLLEKAAILPNHPQYEIPAREDIYRCHHCLKAIQYFVTCPGCDVIFFCGYNCRYYSWNEYHRWECFGLQRGFFPKNDIHYVAMRMLFFELQFNCVEVVVYLLVHTSFFEWIVQFPKYKNKDQFKLYSIIGGSLLKYYYQFQQNSIQIKQVLYHGIPAQNRAEFIADAIFLSTRYFLNDPHPNTDWFVLGNYLVIKAIKDISVGDKITVKWRTDVNDCCCKKCFNAASLNVFKCFHCEKTVKPIEKSDCEFYLNLKYMESISNIEKNIAFICNKCKKISALSEYKEIFVYSQHNIDVLFSMVTFLKK
nr:histone-lysine N-methyltransferase ASHR1-like [Onthophagus taurus]